MKIEDIKKQRHKILTALEDEFVKELVPARVADPSEGKDKTDLPEILTVLMDELAVDREEVVGEFFFMPSGENDEVQIFENHLTLADVVLIENETELLKVCSIINSFMSVGAFCIDPASGNLIYRYAYEMPMDLSDKDLKDSVDLCMGASVEMVRRYGYLIFETAHGLRDAKSVTALFFTD